MSNFGDHTCDRKGRPAKVIDDSGEESLTRIYPTCSEEYLEFCQVAPHGAGGAVS